MTDEEKIFELRLALCTSLGQLELAAQYLTEEGHPLLAEVPNEVVAYGRKTLHETR